MKRIRGKVNPQIARTQFGFISDSGMRNTASTLQTLMEKRPIHMLHRLCKSIRQSKACRPLQNLGTVKPGWKRPNTFTTSLLEKKPAIVIHNEYTKFKPKHAEE